jgi:hypothetical protein
VLLTLLRAGQQATVLQLPVRENTLAETKMQEMHAEVR